MDRGRYRAGRDSSAPRGWTHADDKLSLSPSLRCRELLRRGANFTQLDYRPWGYDRRFKGGGDFRFRAADAVHRIKGWSGGGKRSQQNVTMGK
jgi:hypothetical protein